MTYSKARFQYLIAWPLLILIFVMQFGLPLKNLVVTAIFFQNVEATVTGNEMLCRVVGRTPEAQGEVNKSPIWMGGAWASCADADAYVASNASRYHQMQLIISIPQQVATVEYTAPADATNRIAQLQLFPTLDRVMSKTKEDSIGTKVTIAAHRSDARKVSWP